MEQEFGDLPGDEKIEISLDHRTLIILKNPGDPTVMEICVVGARGTRSDMALVDIAPGEGNAIDVYYNNPKEVVFLRSLPASEFEEEKRLRKDQPR
jgi:hypothetical protein